MAPDVFRRLALSQPNVVEVYYRGHSEFRVLQKPFASLGGPVDSVAMVQLTSEQQAMFMQAAPRTFVPVRGDSGWLRATNVVLVCANDAIVQSALVVAWRNILPISETKSIDASKNDGEMTLKAICEEYIKEEGKRLRSVGWREQVLNRLVYPELGAKQIGDIKRSDIVRLLDKIGDENGVTMADRTLAVVRKIMNWHVSRSDDFRSPIVRGMDRVRQKERARERTLTDDELRIIWRAAEAMEGPFGRFIKFALLTATRRNEAADIRREEVLNGDWIIPAERMKGKREHVVPLSPAAKAIIDDMPKLGAYVFTIDGHGPIRDFARRKSVFDAAVLTELRKQDVEAEPLPRWTLHDLRRTARSLMSRVGVSAEIAERCLGHVMGTVRGVYDRYAYHDEKARAFEALAGTIERIVGGLPV